MLRLTPILSAALFSTLVVGVKLQSFEPPSCGSQASAINRLGRIANQVIEADLQQRDTRSFAEQVRQASANEPDMLKPMGGSSARALGEAMPDQLRKHMDAIPEENAPGLELKMKNSSSFMSDTSASSESSTAVGSSFTSSSASSDSSTAASSASSSFTSGSSTATSSTKSSPDSAYRGAVSLTSSEGDFVGSVLAANSMAATQTTDAQFDDVWGRSQLSGLDTDHDQNFASALPQDVPALAPYQNQFGVFDGAYPMMPIMQFDAPPPAPMPMVRSSGSSARSYAYSAWSGRADLDLPPDPSMPGSIMRQPIG
jgi:hypothetical protein